MKKPPSSPSQIAPTLVDAEAGDAKAQRAVQSVEVGGRLLLTLAAHATAMTLKDLAAGAGLPAARAHPYLVSFGKLGLIEQDAGTGRYALGPAALQLGLSCLHQLDPMKVAVPVAERLAASTDQSVIIALWGNLGPTVVRMIEARQPLHVNMRAGTVMSVLGTATGRAFAAALPGKILEEALAGPMGRFSPADSLGAKELAAELQSAREEMQAHGVTRALGRPVPSVNAFSAAAFDHEGHVALVITALGHADHFDAAWDSAMAVAVREAAAEVSRRLGFATV
ncbi:IclR family transcriptional regulator [Rhodoferax sp.]|uniref:IclR family transcriptional regulator n=1 Tax=Rhodoferax sp. TaxID=50421 RepID=UPI00374CB4A9